MADNADPVIVSRLRKSLLELEEPLAHCSGLASVLRDALAREDADSPTVEAADLLASQLHGLRAQWRRAVAAARDSGD